MTDDDETHRERVRQIIEEDDDILEELDDEGMGNTREIIIRYDPEGNLPPSMPERMQAFEEGASLEEIASLPERRVFRVGDEEDYERIAEAVWGVANAFVGFSIHAGHELVACPECEYEAPVSHAIFPGGAGHYSDSNVDEGDDE